jgi:hypothetical protein
MTGLRSEIATILRSLPGWLWLFAVSWVLLAVYWQCLVHRNGIFGEMWDTLPAYRVLGEMHAADVLRELLRKYAFVHILALPKLGFWIDFHFFGASGQFTRASSFLVSLLCAASMILVATRTYQRTTACVLLGALLFFNGFQAYVINWESLLQYYLAVFFALLAFIEYDKNRTKLLLPSIFLLLSGLSCGAGIAAVAGFSFMVFMQYLNDEKPPRIAMVVYAVFVLLLLYMLFPEAGGAFPQHMAAPFFWNAPGLLLQYLAFPFSAWGDFRWVGLPVLFSVIHSLWVCIVLRRGALPDYLLVFFFLIACTVVLGRYKVMGIDGDVSRYYVYMAPLWFFSLLKLSTWNQIVFRATATVFCVLLLMGSLASSVVLANLANKMAMARTVALNGNFRHFASQRLDATGEKEATLQNSADYLHANSMDIYYGRETAVKSNQAVCRADLLRKAVTSKGGFVDYVLAESPENVSRLSALYLADEAGNILYYGTPFAAVTHLDGWAVALRDVKLTDWPLLLPLSWLKPEQRLLYIHLPRAVPLDSLPAWGEDYRGNWCRLLISAAPE